MQGEGVAGVVAMWMQAKRVVVKLFPGAAAADRAAGTAINADGLQKVMVEVDEVRKSVATASMTALKMVHTSPHVRRAAAVVFVVRLWTRRVRTPW